MTAASYPHPVLSAQSTFRAILDALARPGSVQPIAERIEAPSPLSSGAAAIALALCDHDAPVWLDEGLRSNAAVGEWLRFHCGCPLVINPGEAVFAFVSDAGVAPAFDAFDPGTAEYPDRSTTIVLQVESFGTGQRLTLAGPGIRGRAVIAANPLPADMPARLAFNRALFPRGVDVLLVSTGAVAGLPRSVRMAED